MKEALKESVGALTLFALVLIDKMAFHQILRIARQPETHELIGGVIKYSLNWPTFMLAMSIKSVLILALAMLAGAYIQRQRETQADRHAAPADRRL